MRTSFPLIAAAAALALAACATTPDGDTDRAGTLKMLFPNTVAGFEQGGILGAVDGAAGAVTVQCARLDEPEVRAAFDALAAATDQTAVLAGIRAVRAKGCTVAASAGLLGSALAPGVAPVPVPAPH